MDCITSGDASRSQQSAISKYLHLEQVGREAEFQALAAFNRNLRIRERGQQLGDDLPRSEVQQEQ